MVSCPDEILSLCQGPRFPNDFFFYAFFYLYMLFPTFIIICFITPKNCLIFIKCFSSVVQLLVLWVAQDSELKPGAFLCV